MKKQGFEIFMFVALFGILLAGAFVMGNYDPITLATSYSQAQLQLGNDLSAGIGTAASWIFKLILGATCTGFGIAAYSEISKTYKLWKRQANAGRWQGGPGANFQKAPSSPRMNKQDLMLLALSGRLPQNERPAITYQQPQAEDDDLRIEM